MRRMMWLLFSVVPLLSGCVVMDGGMRVAIDESSRLPVQFEDRASFEAFHEGLARSSRDDYTDVSGFGIPFVAFSARAVFHETHHFNAQVRMTDVDRDGTISSEEAAAYLERTRAEDG